MLSGYSIKKPVEWRATVQVQAGKMVGKVIQRSKQEPVASAICDLAGHAGTVDFSRGYLASCKRL
jgi:hypothetical protein